MAKGRIIEADTAARRAKLLALRRQGIPYDDPRIMGLGYANPGAARKDLTRALQHHHEEEAAEASVYRQQENERLDALLAAVWDKATTPSPVLNKDREVVAEEIDLRAVDTVIKLIDRRAKLNGLDMPVKAEVSGPEGGPLSFSTADPEKLAAIMAATNRLNAPKPENTATSTPADDSCEETGG